MREGAFCAFAERRFKTDMDDIKDMDQSASPSAGAEEKKENGCLCGSPCGSAMEWLRRMRAPAVRFCYRMDKTFLPDADAVKGSGNAPAGSCGGADCSPDGSGAEASCGCGTEASCGTGTPCGMTESGCVTVRFFDLAVVCAVMMLVCGCRRVMDK